MILDKLLEKKDLLNYIGLRIEMLQKEFDVAKYPEHEREKQVQRLNGRIRELKRLNKIVSFGELKPVSKTMWKRCNK